MSNQTYLVTINSNHKTELIDAINQYGWSNHSFQQLPYLLVTIPDEIHRETLRNLTGVILIQPAAESLTEMEASVEYDKYLVGYERSFGTDFLRYLTDQKKTYNGISWSMMPDIGMGLIVIPKSLAPRILGMPGVKNIVLENEPYGPSVNPIDVIRGLLDILGSRPDLSGVAVYRDALKLAGRKDD